MGWVDAEKAPMDPRLEQAKGIDTSMPVREPGGAPVSRGGRWVDAPEQAANTAVPVNNNGGKLPLEPEEQAAFGDMRPNITPDSTLGKLALEASHGYTGNLLPAAEGLLAKVLPNPAGLGRQDYANALNQSRESTGLAPSILAEGAGAIANPAIRALNPTAAGAIMGGGEAASQGGDLGDVAKSAAIGGGLGYGGGKLIGAIASKFPWIADRLAERLTGQTAKQAAARIVGTAKGAFPEGDFANSALKMGLIKPLPGQAVTAGVAAADEAGARLGAMREGLSASPRELSEAIGSHPALDDLREALQPHFPNDVPLNDLSEAVNQNVVNPLNKLTQQAADPRAPITSQSTIRALQQAKQRLNALQDAKIVAKGVDPGEYDAARKAYAIASGVTRGEARTAAQAAVRKGRGALIGLAVGHPFVGMAVGDRPAAYAALKAYQAARSAPAQMLAKAAKVATPGVQQAVARATASGQPEQAGAAIQKAQANDPDAR